MIVDLRTKLSKDLTGFWIFWHSRARGCIHVWVSYGRTVTGQGDCKRVSCWNTARNVLVGLSVHGITRNEDSLQETFDFLINEVCGLLFWKAPVELECLVGTAIWLTGLIKKLLWEVQNELMGQCQLRQKRDPLTWRACVSSDSLCQTTIVLGSWRDVKTGIRNQISKSDVLSAVRWANPLVLVLRRHDAVRVQKWTCLVVPDWVIVLRDV